MKKSGIKQKVTSVPAVVKPKPASTPKAAVAAVAAAAAAPAKSKKAQPSSVDAAAEASPAAPTLNALDDIFAQLGKRKAEAKEKREKEEADVERKKKTQKKRSNTLSVLDDLGKPVSYTDDGLPVFTTEQLNMNKGGGTPIRCCSSRPFAHSCFILISCSFASIDTDLCPFDCDCCF
jgi:hypothetical protein